jgi:peptidoglycan hydrolase CwlO-like protein
MLKKITVAVATMLVATSFCQAQTAPAKQNTHRNYDQAARECKKMAAEQQLSGDELLAFVAKCMKG